MSEAHPFAICWYAPRDPTLCGVKLRKEWGTGLWMLSQEGINLCEFVG
ncbi:hypothetical protein AciPR4_1661 [Terriglobus saanensis SP1PR4]|uniref:Uncharacterized protein n=1 Tax=Terriglobus saanensis (strain ATCC BAA-1853 / DSM 23119 / SP1PR4) TaxID=401053 RepID=E8V3B1_TERSS|nr:hypothetical protein AciPR4_1661 [Terriglobus saanensis SP1PR4]